MHEASTLSLLDDVVMYHGGNTIGLYFGDAGSILTGTKMCFMLTLYSGSHFHGSVSGRQLVVGATLPPLLFTYFIPDKSNTCSLLGCLLAIHCRKSFPLHFFFQSGTDFLLPRVHRDGWECLSVACPMTKGEPWQPDIILGKIPGEQLFSSEVLCHRCSPNPRWRLLLSSSS